MALPWVSRSRFDDLARECDRLRLENGQQLGRIIALTASNAGSETKAAIMAEQLEEMRKSTLALEIKLSEMVNHPPEDGDDRPIGGRIRLRDVIAKANTEVAKKNAVVKTN